MNTKAQSLGNALLGIALVIVIFSAGFYFSGPKAGVTGGAITTAEYNANIAATHEKNGLYPNAGEFYKLAGDEYKKDGNYDKASEMYKNAYTNYKTAGLNDKYAETVELYARTEIIKGIITPAPVEEVTPPVIENKVVAEEEAVAAQPDGTQTHPFTEIPPDGIIKADGWYTIDSVTVKLKKDAKINQVKTDTISSADTSSQTGTAPKTTATYAYDVTSKTSYEIKVDTASGETTYTKLNLDGTPSSTTITIPSNIAEEGIDWNVYAQGKGLVTTDGKTTITQAGETYTYTEGGKTTREVIGTTTKEFTYKTEKGKENDIDTVTYKTSTGTLTVNGDVYSQIKDQPLLFTAAIDAGMTYITSANYNKDTATITYGGVTIKKDSNNNIISYRTGNDVEATVYSSSGKTVYEGVNVDAAGTIKKEDDEDYIEEVYDSKGVLTNRNVNEGGKLTTTIYNTDNTMTISTLDDKDVGYTISTQRGTDGYFTLTYYYSSTNYYFDGSNIYSIDDKGKYVKVEASALGLTDEQFKALTGALADGINAKRASENEPTISQENWQKRFATIEAIFTEFSGLRGFSQLFWSDEDLDEWRESVDKVFASMYLGTDYWVSDICSKGVEREGEGTMYIETPGGLLEVGAHIEAEKTEPIDYQNGTSERLYKITYKVTNPEYEATTRERPEISFNVYLYGDITVQLYSEDIVVEEGGSFSRMGSSAIVQYSSHEYDKVCIVFSDSILAVGTRDVSEVCNEVTMYTGPATEYQTTGVEVTSGGSGYGYGEEVDF